MKALSWLILLLVGAGFAGLLASMKEPVGITFGTWDIAVPYGLFFFLLYLFVCFFILVDRVLQQYANFIRWRQIRSTYKARAIMLRGLSLLAARETDKAREAADKIHDLWYGDRDDPFLLVFEGRLAEEEGDFLHAQDCYERLEKQKDARLVALRAQLRLAQHTQDAVALKRLTKLALKLAPDDLTLYEARVDALIGREQWNKAHAVFHTLARRNLMSEDAVAARRADLYLEQSASLLAAGKHAEARNVAKQAYKTNPTPEALAAELDAIFASGNVKEAHKKIAEAWSQNADSVLLPYWDKLAPSSDAFKHYEGMLKANAAHPLTHASLVKAALLEGKSMEARAHLEALHRIAPDSAEYAESRAMVAEQLDRDMAEARQWKSRADALRMAQFSKLSRIKTKSRLLSDVFE